MFRTLSYFLGAAFCILTLPQISTGQEAADATAETAKQVSELGTGLVTNIQKALNNDVQARQELMNEYLVPAAMALILLIVGYLFASFVGRIVGNTVTKRVDKTIGRFSGKMTQNVIMVMVILGALGYFGVDVTSFAAILAAAGFAVGMALQGTLSNFAAGVMLLVFRPFQIDDYIEVAGSEGVVEEIELFTTRMNTVDNRQIIVPNSQIFGEKMVNFTKNSSRRVDVNVGVAYDADIRMTRSVLENAISNIPDVMESPETQVYLVELGDSALHWQCRVWCSTENYWAVREVVTEQVKYALDQAHISIPFPQMDINVAGKLFAKAA